jgi:hypothetical protein
MGGGFDVFCGLPIYFELKNHGLNVHLANYSFSDIAGFDGGVRLTETLVGVTAEYQWHYAYFPELYLAQWFKEKRAEDIAVWAFHKTGGRLLLEDYRTLVKHLGTDAIILIDGGVDSLIQGDEFGTGSLIEDALSLFVVNNLSDIPARILACVGLGAEQDIDYGAILENIARLSSDGGFLGTCARAPQMDAYQQYEDAVISLQANVYQDPSVINSSITPRCAVITAIITSRKDRGSRLWTSPPMALYCIRYSRMFITPRPRAQRPLP